VLITGEETMVRLGLALMILEVLIVVAVAQVTETVPNTSSSVDGVTLGLEDTPRAESFTPAPPSTASQATEAGRLSRQFSTVFDRLMENDGVLTAADQAALADLERQLRAQAPGESVDLWNLVAMLNRGAERFAARFHNALAAGRQRYYRGLARAPVTWHSAQSGR
jgi:hypothetical protein